MVATDIEASAFEILRRENAGEVSSAVEGHMSKLRVAIVATIGIGIGLSAAIWNPVEAQDSPRSCTVARNFGTVKTMWDNQLVFESSTGTIRLVDDRCRVRQIIQRR